MGIIQPIPDGLLKTVERHLSPGEKIVWQLKGAWKEALVCTNQRVIIAKSGFMTGQIFGSDIFQVSYSGIASAQVKFHLLTGYFEVSSGGMQNTAKSYWATKGSNSAAKEPNSISLNSRAQADQFRAAAAFIMEQSNIARAGSVAAVSAASTHASVDLGSTLERLWALKSQGALSEEEYHTAKAKALAGTEKGQETSPAGFQVRLISAGNKPINVMALYRNLTGASIGDAKKAIEGAPTVVLSGVAEQYANRVKDQFTAAGATATVQAVS
jgi:ribosomal protein L7/L12